MEPNKVSARAEVSTSTTRNIKVSVQCSPLTQESDPTASVFAFSYTISIENLGHETVQLMERHWKIFSAERQIGEVVGPGVVGKQPVLAPGQQHTYTSGTVIHDPFGYMCGEYTFQAGSGNYFEVEIPRFDLIFPGMLH